MNQQWQEKLRPHRLEGRYEFENYDALRNFLDRAAELSERDGLYPDLGFGRDYVNVTIYAEEGSGAVADRQRRFAAQLDAIYPTGTSS
jgi:4a-hydroxytetrahydrobiopterin dehydratase